MLKRLKFAFSYALRNIIRDRQRTAFALFSIAAGVATVVALRMLGLMLTDALTSNAQAIMRGDVTAELFNRGPRISFLQNSSRNNIPITADNQKIYDDWAARHGYDIQYALTSELMQAAVVNDDKAGSPAFTNSYFVDPKIYPFYDRIRAEDPPGASLATLLTGPDQVVIGHRLAVQLGTKVGDTLRVGAAPRLQTVVGIVPDSSESNLSSPFNLFFSFVYVDRAYADQFGLPAGAADKIFLRLPPTQDVSQVQDQMRREWPGRAGRWRIDNAPRLLKNNTVTADLVSRFVLLLSLIALVIGGVGIINTMLVSVNRRSGEIAVLKTLGLRGSNVGLLFLSEAVILGLVGSILGLVVGLLLSLVAQQFGEQAFNVVLPWRFNVEPLAIGIALGLIITLIFSIFPAMLASQVRPNNVLRTGGIPLARGGCLTSLFSLVIVLAALSALSEAIIGNTRDIFPQRGLTAGRAGNLLTSLPLGVIGTLSVFLLIVVLLALIWVFVWLLGKLPSLRNPNLRIAIRALTLHRSRTALSLLALIIGMTALSATLIGTRSLTMLLQTTASEPLGGNVVILPFLPLSSGLVHLRLDNAAGVSGYRDVRIFSSDLQSINGDTNFDQKINAADDVQRQTTVGQLNILLGIQVHGNPPRGKLVEGRYLGPEDAGKYDIVVPELATLAPLNIHVGSTFTYRIGNANHDFQVVGVVAPDDRTGLIPFSLGDSAVQAPLDVARSAMPFDITIANVDPNAVNDVMASVGAVPGIFVFDTSVFDSIINRILTQLAALPLLVAGLSLFAATVLIATTVSLATMERRRQIAVLKALGVTRKQALNQLLLENAIVGAAGGIISLLPTLLVLGLVPVLTGDLGYTVRLPVPVDLIIIMFVLSIVITLAATLLSAWSASGEKPLAALRYE